MTNRIDDNSGTLLHPFFLVAWPPSSGTRAASAQGCCVLVSAIKYSCPRACLSPLLCWNIGDFWKAWFDTFSSISQQLVAHMKRNFSMPMSLLFKCDCVNIYRHKIIRADRFLNLPSPSVFSKMELICYLCRNKNKNKIWFYYFLLNYSEFNP